MKGQIAENESVVYWVAASGQMMIAPDSRMRPFPGMQRVECRTVGEIESFSRRYAQQEYSKFRHMKVEEHLRSSKRREQLKANCKLRLASGCISEQDELMTRKTLQSLERKDDLLLDMLFKEPDLSRACLEIERHEDGVIRANHGKKRRGLGDDDVNLIASLAGV